MAEPVLLPPLKATVTSISDSLSSHVHILVGLSSLCPERKAQTQRSQCVYCYTAGHHQDWTWTWVSQCKQLGQQMLRALAIWYQQDLVLQSQFGPESVPYEWEQVPHSCSENHHLLAVTRDCGGKFHTWPHGKDCSKNSVALKILYETTRGLYIEGL